MGKINLWIRAAITFTIITLIFQQSAFAISATATASPSTIQQGQTSQLNCTGSGGSGTYYYSWSSVPPGFVSTIQNPVVAPTVTTTYTCRVFNGGSYTFTTVTVYVTAGSGLTATATATPSTISAGQNSQLNCEPAGGSGNYTYAWTSSPAGFTSTQKTPTVTPSVNTTYTCTVTSGSSTATATTAVTVIPPLSATTTATPGTITAGGSSQLNCTPSGGTGTYTYAWTSVPAGFTSTQKNPTVTPSVTTTYTCAVTSGSQNVTSNVSVTVNTIPGLTATTTATPSTINAGQNSQLNCNPAGGTGTYTYSWTSVPAGFTSTLKNPTVTPSANTTYTCAVTSGSQNVTSSVSVTVNTIPGLTATTTATPSTINAGQNSQLNCNPAGGTGTYTYSWTSVPAGFTSTLKNPTVTPSVTTTYTCAVTSGSQNVTSSVSVTVNAIPGLTATTTATPSTINAGQNSQLNCNPAGGTGTYTYSWTSVPAGFTSTLKNPIVTPSANTTYTCAVTSGSQNVTSSVSVTVNTIPGLTASSTATPPSINPGQASNLNCNPSGGTGTYTYSWTSVPAGFNSTLKNPTVTPSVTTTYNCTVTSGTQTTTTSTSVNVATIPALTASATASPADITQGQNSTLNCTATGGTGNYTYSWTSNPAGFTSTQQSPVVTPSATTIYTCTVTSGTQTATATATVRVTTIPALSVSTTATPSTITQGQSSELNCIATGGSGTYSYSWTSVPAGFTSSQPNAVVSPTVTTTYTCMVVSGTQTGTSSVTVTVNTINPTLGATATATPSTIRSGQSSQLNCIPTGGSGTYTYLWTSSPAGFTSTLKNPVVYPKRTTTYTVQVSDGTSNAIATVKVRVNGGQLAGSVYADQSVICSGETIHAEAMPEGGSGNYTYSWTSNPPSFASNDKTIDLVPGKSMRLVCEISDGDTTITATTDIVVNQTPSVFAGNDTTIANNASASLKGIAKHAASVEWTTDGDGTFSDRNNEKSNYTPGPADLSRGSVTLRLTANAAAPCFGSVNSSMTIAFKTATSVPDPEENNYGVTVYPNPTTGPVHVRFTGNEDTDAIASVVDMQGKVLETRPLRISLGVEVHFDLSSYARGIYFITIDAGNYKKTHKVVLK